MVITGLMIAAASALRRRPASPAAKALFSQSAQTIIMADMIQGRFPAPVHPTGPRPLLNVWVARRVERMDTEWTTPGCPLERGALTRELVLDLNQN